MRGKRLVQIVPAGISEKTFPLPEKIMVVRNCRHAGLCNDLCDGQAQRNVEWNRERILGNQKIQAELFNKLPYLPFENVLDTFDLQGCLLAPRSAAKTAAVCLFYFRMLEMAFGNKEGTFPWGVQFPGHVEALTTHFFQNFCPLLRFQ